MCNFIYFKIIEVSLNVCVCISQITNGFLFNESFEKRKWGPNIEIYCWHKIIFLKRRFRFLSNYIPLIAVVSTKFFYFVFLQTYHFVSRFIFRSTPFSVSRFSYTLVDITSSHSKEQPQKILEVSNLSLIVFFVWCIWNFGGGWIYV